MGRSMLGLKAAIGWSKPSGDDVLSMSESMESRS